MITHERAKELMLEAFKVAQNSTCARRRVGAVIADQEGNIVSTGWNHHMKNKESCESVFFREYLHRADIRLSENMDYFVSVLLNETPATAHATYKELLTSTEVALWEKFLEYTKTPEFKQEHKEYQNREVHSELSAILNAYAAGKSVANCIIFSSRSPCVACAHAIAEAGLSKCYYTEKSDAGSLGVPLLSQYIDTEHLELEEVPYWT